MSPDDLVNTITQHMNVHKDEREGEKERIKREEKNIGYFEDEKIPAGFSNQTEDSPVI
jgi:hypothetical protein